MSAPVHNCAGVGQCNRCCPSAVDRAYKFHRLYRSSVRRVLARIAVHIPGPAIRSPSLNEKSMENKLLDLNELSALLGRSPETIKKDMKRNRLAVPPRLHIPGTRLLRWRRIDVDIWLASHVESRPGDAK